MTTLDHVELLDDGQAVAIRWADDYHARYHAIWLRDNAQDEATRSPSNGQRLITIQDIPEATRIAGATIVDGVLELSFVPEEKRIRYRGDWLRLTAYDLDFGERRGYLPSNVETWDGKLDPADVSSTFTDIAERQNTLRTWLSHVRRYGFARLTGGPIESGALLDVVELFGYVRETNYGKWFEVRTEIKPSNLAFTGLGLQAHTDNPYRDPSPTLQILYCLENAAEGGDSQVIDGFHAAKRLQALAPESFDLLSRHCARFSYQIEGKVHLTARKPMIELDADGRLAAIRFNNRSIAPITDVAYADMPAYYAAYRRFSEIIDDPALAVDFKLEPGDSFIVDNTRVLHGRTGYAAEAGSRWLQGCYADKDGLLSTLAVLEQQAKRTA